MLIIKIKQNENGSHNNQTVTGELLEIPEGWAVVPENLQVPNSFPFMDIEVNNQTVTSMTPREAPEIEPIEPDKPPTPELLSAQIKATNERQEFIEDCIAELATLVYNE